MTWFDSVKRLPSEVIEVRHEPFTARYHRAWQRLEMIVRAGIYLGSRAPEEAPDDRFREIAVWAPPTTGRGFGAYCCFRLEIEQSRVRSATLFCYYDGDECPGFTTLARALSFARTNGFALEVS